MKEDLIRDKEIKIKQNIIDAEKEKEVKIQVQYQKLQLLKH